MDFKDLAENSDTLISLIGSFAFLCGILIAAIYKINTKMLSGVLANQKQCMNSLPHLYAPKEDTQKSITTLFDRQSKLRDEILPGTYVLRAEMVAWNQLNENGFKAITARLDTVCLKLDKLAEGERVLSKQEGL